jgi:4-carboxymuconolactone decarboxylase
MILAGVPPRARKVAESAQVCGRREQAQRPGAFDGLGPAVRAELGGSRDAGRTWLIRVNPVRVRAMTRIPYVRREELGPEGQQLWDAIVDGRGDLLVTADGGLAGPFNAFVTAPGAGRRMSSLGVTLRFGTSIERRLSEIAIITIGARWQAEFEWWAHAPMAREHGVADAVVDAIGRGEDPPFEVDDERAVYAVARQLGYTGRLDQETYEAAHQFLGHAGMVELVSLCGYYTLISFLLNAFVVPLPPDVPPMWDRS